MTCEDAYYYRLLLQAGFTTEFDAWFDERLASDTPYSDLIIDLSMCRSDINETISLLLRFCEDKTYDMASVYERLRLFLKDAYHSGRLSKKETVEAMYRLASIVHYPHDWDDDLAWWDIYYLADYYDMAVDGILGWDRFDAAFLAYLDDGTPIDPDLF